MRPKRVVIINDASIARGGATGLSLLLARQLRGAGLEVAFVCGDSGENPELSELGVEVVALGSARLNSAGGRALVTGIRNSGAEAMLRRFIQQTDTPDTVYHLHGWAQILSPFIFHALQPVADRTLIHAHDFFLACPNGAFTNYATRQPCALRPLGAACLTTQCDKRNYAQKLWRVTRQSALNRHFKPRDGWFGISMIHPSMAPFLRRAGYPEDMLRIVRNPVTPFSTTRIAAEQNDRFVFIGRIEPDKGVRELAAAAHKAGVALTCVGEGPVRGELEAEYPEITFTGWQDRAGIAEVVKAARCVVMPSISPEPFGLVAAESALSGLPVIISETALLAPEFAQNGLGLAVRSSDPDLFAAALAEMRDMSPEAIREISEAAFSGRANIATSPELWTEMLIDLYTEALA